MGKTIKANEKEMAANGQIDNRQTARRIYLLMRRVHNQRESSKHKAKKKEKKRKIEVRKNPKEKNKREDKKLNQQKEIYLLTRRALI